MKQTGLNGPITKTRIVFSKRNIDIAKLSIRFIISTISVLWIILTIDYLGYNTITHQILIKLIINDNTVTIIGSSRLDEHLITLNNIGPARCTK